MFSIFIEAYFPTLRGGVTPSGWLLKFPNTADSSTLFPLALDVLCLSHLGRSDAQMKKPAFSAYAKMVATLRRSLQLPSHKFSTIDHRMVAASMIALALLDAPDTSTWADWMVHWDAAYRFVSTRGPSYFNICDPLTEALLRELFQGSIFLGLARRESLPSPHTAWMKSCLFGQARGIRDCGLRNLYPDDVQIPNVVALSDRLLEDPRDSTVLQQYLDAVTEAKASIRTSISATLGAGSPKRVYASDHDAHDPEIEEHCFISMSTAIGYQYQFPSMHNNAYHASATYVRSSFYSLILVCTELRLLHFSPLLQKPGRLARWEDLEDHAYRLAIECCRSVWQMSKPISLAIPQWIDLYLEVAQGVFEEQSRMELVGWCQACRIASRLRLGRFACTRPPTLCRIGDLPKGIRKLGRYRSWNMK